MSTPVIDRKETPLLGKEERAEQLVNWSMRHPAGKRWTKDFDFGLRLGFVSADAEPRLYIHWNPQKFQAWLDGLGATPVTFCLKEYGITVTYINGRTRLCLLGAGDTGKVLWDTKKSFCYQQSRPEEKGNVNWLLGMINFGEEGPVFMDVPEAQSQLQDATALAVITDKSKEAPVVRPKAVGKPGQVLQPPPLSERAKAFLLQDILLNRLTASTG